VANFWYEVRTKGAKLEKLRHLMFREHHPVEKVMRVGLGPLTVEGIPRGRYRLLDEREAEELKTGKVVKKRKMEKRK
jgi:16S rRNA U516 pseudouridylate synthase RsuA-like enzyme